MSETKRPYRPGDRARAIDRVLDATDEMFRNVSDSHTAEFLEIGVTMPQAKVLHLVAAEGRMRMSVLAARLGVTLSTVSGLIDRLVEARCVARHDDPTDRRQVVVTLTPEGDALIEHFRDLNRRQMQSLLELLADDDLDAVERAVGALTRAAERRAANPTATVASAPGDRSGTTVTTARHASATAGGHGQTERDRS